MRSLLLDSFKTPFAQEVEFGEEKGQRAAHSLPSTREVALPQRLPRGAGAPGRPPLTYIPPWLSTALRVKTGPLGLACKASTVQPSRPLDPHLLLQAP